jgi:hypothetical protein
MSTRVSVKRTLAGIGTAGAVFLLGLVPSSPAMADSAGGVARSSAATSARTVVNVGGGTWNYGTGSGCSIYKCAWSHYVHPSLYHSATSICASANVKRYANAGDWANADTRCGWAQSTAAYWNTY